MADRKSQIAQRLKELDQQGRAISKVGRDSGHVSQSHFYAWASSALNLLQNVFGGDSPHFLSFEAELDQIEHNYVSDRKLEATRGIFLGAKSDFDGDHLFTVEAALTGKVFGDFVAAAKAA